MQRDDLFILSKNEFNELFEIEKPEYRASQNIPQSGGEEVMRELEEFGAMVKRDINIEGRSLRRDLDLYGRNEYSSNKGNVELEDGGVDLKVDKDFKIEDKG